MFLLEKGGFFIWPLLAVAVWALYLILERAFYYAFILRPQRRHLALIKDGESLPDEAGRSRLLKALLDARTEKRLPADLAEQHVERDLQDAEYGLTSLSIIAQASPLLGLLGTVAGLIRVFIRIEALSGAVSPADLAGGIWEALLTTLVGLAIAIPALIAYGYFTSSLQRYERELHLLLTRVIDDFRRRGWEVV
jgi:biopolymer transport protein ExbB